MESDGIERDVKILLSYCKIGQFLGLVPGNLGGRSAYSKLQYVSAAVVVTFFTLSAGLNIYTMITDPRSKLLLLTISAFQSLSDYDAITYYYYKNMVHPEHWKQFFDGAKTFRRRVHNAGYTFTTDEKLHSHIIMIPLALLINAVINLRTGSYYQCVTLNFRLNMLFQLLTVILISCMTKVLKNRYEFLNALLRKFIGDSDMDENALISNIQLLKVLYRNCYFMTGTLNGIFGWIIFSLVISTTSSSVSCLILFFDMCIQTDEQNYVILAFTCANLFGYVCIYSGYLVTLIVSCDQTEKEGRKFVDFCYDAHGQCDNRYVKEELKSLAIISEKISPKFSAAGFYNVNQMFFSTFLPVITSYAIVSIQLNSLYGDVTP